MKDREEIVSAFKQCGLPGACLKCKYGAEREGCYAALKHDVIELLKEQPEQKIFIDSDGKMTPLPVQKHGHWKGFTQSRYFGNDDDGEPIFRDGLFYVCSECRRKTVIKTSYCPQCGAKMDEKVKNED